MTEPPRLDEDDFPLGIDENTRAYLRELRDYYAKQMRAARSQMFRDPPEDRTVYHETTEHAMEATAYQNRKEMCEMLLAASGDMAMIAED